MPAVPHPGSGEEENTFMGRCLHKLKHDPECGKMEHPQRIAICMTSWREKESQLTDEEILKLVMDADVRTIKAKNPGLLQIPEGKKFYEMPLSHYIGLAKSKGRAAIMRGLLNLERWNKQQNPGISEKARGIINKLKENSEWVAMGEKDQAMDIDGRKMDNISIFKEIMMDIDRSSLGDLVGKVILDSRSTLDEKAFDKFDHEKYECAADCFNQCNGDLDTFMGLMKNTYPDNPEDELNEMFINFQSLIDTFQRETQGK